MCISMVTLNPSMKLPMAGVPIGMLQLSAIIQDTGGSSADILASGSIQFQVGEHGREGRELSCKPCASVPGLASGISSLGSSVASVMRL